MSNELSQVPPGVWGLIGTVLGGFIIHFSQKRLKASDLKYGTRDYRNEISELVIRLDRLEDEVTFWRNRFYEEQEATALLRIILIQNGIDPPTLIPRSPEQVRIEDDMENS